MSMEKFDVVVVGGGVAGAAAAYRLAKGGAKVILIERGQYAGAKNMTGGRLYTHSLEELMPDFRSKAPLERRVTQEKLSILCNGEATTIGYEAPSCAAKDESYVVLRSKFDRWMVQEAEKAGALVINRIQVTDLLMEGDQVVGVQCGQDRLKADLVILADGVNSLLAQRAGFRRPITAEEIAVSAKEVYTLPKGVLEDRFGLDDKEGASWLCLGDMTHGLLGGGFIYTNKTSVSVGIVVGLSRIGETHATVEDMLEEFTNYPFVKRLLKGGKLVERSGHMVPEGGAHCVSRLSGPGYMIVGDAAGFCVNLGYTVRGMDFAIASGMYAADAALKAIKTQNFSVGATRLYDILVERSFIRKDLELYRNMPDFLNNDRIFGTYPLMVNGIMKDVFTVNGDGAKPLVPKLLQRVVDAGMLGLLQDAWKGVRSL